LRGQVLRGRVLRGRACRVDEECDEQPLNPCAERLTRGLTCGDAGSTKSV
jgi:hypothetical protein